MSRIDLNKFIDDLTKKNFGKNLFLFSMGMLVQAFAFNLFFDKYSVNPGGSSGLSLLLSQFFPIDIALIIFVVGLVLLILGLVFFGFKYATKMLLVTFLYPFFVTSTTLVTRFIDLEGTSLFLIMVFGGGIMGFGSGLIRKSNYNPGGFSVLYDLMYKYFHVSIGASSIIINSILIFGGGFILGFESAIYSVIALIVSSYIVDRVIIGISDNKVFYIITDRPLEVSEYITDKLHYSVTIVNARGGYSNKRKKILMSVIPTIEYVGLKELVREIDPNVFFLIVDAYESSVKKNCKYM